MGDLLSVSQDFVPSGGRSVFHLCCYYYYSVVSRHNE